MKTIMFIENEKDVGRMVIGFNLSKLNYHYSPPGIIRIARFKNSFDPKNNTGYYGDIYMNNLVKKWKKGKREKEIIQVTNLLIKKNFCDEIINEIIKYI